MAKNDVPVLRGYMRALLRLFDTSRLSESDYAADSWSALVSADQAARQLLGAEVSFAGAPSEKDDLQNHKAAFCNLYRACYWGLTPADGSTIRVSLKFIDANAARGGSQSPGAGYINDSLVLSSGYTVGDALSAAGITLSSQVRHNVFLNGVYVDYYYGEWRDYGFSAETGDSYKTAVRLRDGDEIVSSLANRPSPRCLRRFGRASQSCHSMRPT
jgi:hypothetical protein